MMNGLSYDLFIDLLASLKSTSDLKWIMKSLNTDQYLIKSQDPNLSNYQKKKLLEQNVKLALQKVLPETGHELESSINKGMKMLEDFHSNKKVTTISLMGYILIKILKSKLQGLYINEQKILMMKSNFHKTPVIFVPSHKSYLDFILMAFVCFNYNIRVPYVAAAMDFKNMKVIGNVLRQCGAFFLHRGDCAQNIINRTVLNEYIKFLISYENSPLQFFIEGTRSRSNKSYLPKLGILKCIVNVLLQNEVQDITIIPISINYDRLPEDKLYSYELLGIPKPKETTFGLINSIKNMDNLYGSVYINFSTPISLKDYIRDMHAIGNSNESHMVLTLAYEIINRQQQNMIISYFNIVAVVLIYNLFNKMTDEIHLDIMIEQIIWIRTLFEKCGAQIETKDGDIKNRIIDSIKQHQYFVALKDNNMVQFQKDCIVNNNIQLSGKKQFNTKTFNHTFPLILNQLYVNPLLHFGINIAFIIIISKCRIIWKNDVLNLEGKFILLRKLFEYEFTFFDGFEKQDFKKSISLYLQINENEKQLLRYLTVYPYILSYRLIYSSLINTCQKIIPEEYIYKSIYMNITESHIHPYGFTKDLIKAALDALNKIKIIHKYKKDNTTFYEINEITIMELINIFDNIIENDNILLKSKI